MSKTQVAKPKIPGLLGPVLSQEKHVTSPKIATTRVALSIS